MLLKLSDDRKYFAAHVLIDALGHILAWPKHGEVRGGIAYEWTMDNRPASYKSDDGDLTVADFMDRYPDFQPVVKRELQRDFHTDMLSTGVDVWMPVHYTYHMFGNEVSTEQRLIEIYTHPRNDNLVSATLRYEPSENRWHLWFGFYDKHKHFDHAARKCGGRYADLIFGDFKDLRFAQMHNDTTNWLERSEANDLGGAAFFIHVWVHERHIDDANTLALTLDRRVHYRKSQIGLGDHWSADLWHPDHGEVKASVGYCYDMSDAMIQLTNGMVLNANQFNYDNVAGPSAWTVRGLYCTDG